MGMIVSKPLKKIFYAAFTIFLAITAIFFVIRLTPGDPIETIIGPKATGEEIFKLKEKLGMNLPLIIQYKNYLLSLAKGDFGKSLLGSKDINALLKERMPATFIIAFVSVFLSAVIGSMTGVLVAFKRNFTVDNLSRLITLFALSFPIFSLAPILVLIFAIKLRIFPVSEWGTVKHAILPILTLVIPLSSTIMRVTRNKFLEEKSEPFVVVLMAKGLSDTQILFRIFKVCLPTILNVVSIQLSVVLAGTMITETIFDIPGMGSLLFDGIQGRDYPVVQAVIIYSTCIYMFIYFLLDFVNEKIDPRITLGSSDD